MTCNTLKENSTNNRLAYFGFLGLGIVYMIFMQDFALGASMIALSLIFDPFDSSVHWRKRPMFQKFLLTGHLIASCCLIVIALIQIIG